MAEMTPEDAAAQFLVELAFTVPPGADVSPGSPLGSKLMTLLRSREAALRAERDAAATCEHCGNPKACPGEQAERIAGLEANLDETLTRAEKAERERDALVAVVREALPWLERGRTHGYAAGWNYVEKLLSDALLPADIK